MGILAGLAAFTKGASVVKDAFSVISKPLSAGLGLGIGFKQRRQAGMLRKQAERFLPGPEDPEVRNFQNLIKRKARAMETGTDPITATGKKLIAKSQATTQGNIVRSAGGDPRRVLEGLKVTGKQTSDAISKLTASTFPASQYYTTAASNILGKISSRKFDLKMSQRAQALRESAEKKSASNANISGALGIGLPA